jgi:hypothetical protein
MISPRYHAGTEKTTRPGRGLFPEALAPFRTNNRMANHAAVIQMATVNSEATWQQSLGDGQDCLRDR